MRVHENIRITKAQPETQNFTLTENESFALIVFKTPLKKGKKICVKWKSLKRTAKRNIGCVTPITIFVRPFQSLSIRLAGREKYTELVFDVVTGNFSELFLYEIEFSLAKYYVEYDNLNPERINFIIGNPKRFCIGATEDAEGNYLFSVKQDQNEQVSFSLRADSEGKVLVGNVYDKVKEIVSKDEVRNNTLLNSDDAHYELFNMYFSHFGMPVMTLETPD